MYNPALNNCITTALARFDDDLPQTTPFLTNQIETWMSALSRTHQPADYFKHPLAFPSLLLPWWVEETLQQTPDEAFQTDLVYSTINGYYYIRLLDNVMDDDADTERTLLPASNVFHTQFQAIYHQYFSADHPFWAHFKTIWFQSAEATMRDASITTLDEQAFREIAAQKVCAAKIPITAVCYHYQQLDTIEPWAQLVDTLGCWHQMINDLFDWHKDLQHQNQTYFLSEAQRQTNETDPKIITQWILDEGFTWGTTLIETWLNTLKQQAELLRSESLQNYLHERETLLLEQKEGVEKGLKSLAKLVAATA
ncbi:MAG: hypothetical protein AAF485_05705 [Chloroflexota bacterium]